MQHANSQEWVKKLNKDLSDQKNSFNSKIETLNTLKKADEVMHLQ